VVEAPHAGRDRDETIDPSGSRTTRRAGQRRRSRGDLVAAALGILDDRGLADLTMRALASSVGVQASALYWHFPNKQALLAAVADEIVAAAEPRIRATTAPSDDRRGRLAATATALRGALFAVKDGAEVVASTVALGHGQGRAHAYLVDAVMGEPGDRTDPAAARASAVAASILHFLLGHVAHEQQRLQAELLGADLEPGAFTADEASFAFGLGLLLDGVDALGAEASEPLRARRS